MANFEIGDRVVCLTHYGPWNEKHGTVCAQYHGAIGLSFDEPIGMHSCGGVCENGHGAWISPDNLRYETGLSSIPENKLMEVIFSEN